MKRNIAFIVVVLLAVGALYYVQKHKAVPVSSNAVLNAMADTQRDLSRIPARMTRLSDEEEIRIGNQLASRYTSEMPQPSAQQRAYQAYVSRVGMGLGARAKRNLPYQFHLIPDSNLLNAFALPGGHVYIGQGLLDLMTSEDELANVLGHEVEHIDHYHFVERVQVETQLRHLHLGIISELVQLPITVWQIGYTKDQEFEADREGTSLAVRAGYSPYGALKMFERFAQLHDEYVIHARSPQQELSQVAIQSITGYFRSHPLPSERIAQIKSLIQAEHWQDRKELKPFRVEYEIKSGE